MKFKRGIKILLKRTVFTMKMKPWQTSILLLIFVIGSIPPLRMLRTVREEEKTINQQVLNWEKNATPQAKSEASAIEDQLKTLQHGDIIKIENRMFFIEAGSQQSGWSNYCKSISALDCGLHLSPQIKYVASRLGHPIVIKVGAPGYDQALLQFAKQTPTR